MIKLNSLTASFILAAGLSACADAAQGAAILTAREAKARLDADPSIILLDVRTPEEYAQRHIPKSVLLPLDTIDASAASVLKDKKKTIFVYCRSGRRSAIAAQQLVKMGYSSVYDIGGIITWPYETVTGK
jgi:rhodanese-related sulfurtransferase